MRIWIFSDGKQGHLSQSRGLADALISRVGGSVRVLSFAGLGLLARFRMAWNLASDGDLPDVMIGAGHRVHLPLLVCKYRLGTLSVVCMNPSFPAACFDLCVIPLHDLRAGHSIAPSKHLIPTRGAMNTVQASPHIQKDQVLVLIGGPSKEFGWDSELLIAQLLKIEGATDLPILLTTSRRTPESFLPELAHCNSTIRMIGVQDTTPAWLQNALAHAKQIWVTRDSVSMVYESLTTGVQVGILDMPAKSAKSVTRVRRGIDQLVNDGYLLTLPVWLQDTTAAPYSQEPLSEATRVADAILQHYPYLVNK